MGLGSTITKLRKEKKLTLKEVAASADISNNALVAIEKGRSLPTKRTFYAICDAIHIPYYLVLIECVTVEDIAPEKKGVFKVLWPILIKYLKND